MDAATSGGRWAQREGTVRECELRTVDKQWLRSGTFFVLAAATGGYVAMIITTNEPLKEFESSVPRASRLSCAQRYAPHIGVM